MIEHRKIDNTTDQGSLLNLNPDQAAPGDSRSLANLKGPIVPIREAQQPNTDLNSQKRSSTR